MPDHEFDNALGERARQLLLEPSPAVWEAVAARLKEKKRRRALAWWFSAASLLFFSAAGWWYQAGHSGGHTLPVTETAAPAGARAGLPITETPAVSASASKTGTQPGDHLPASAGNGKALPPAGQTAGPMDQAPSPSQKVLATHEASRRNHSDNSPGKAGRPAGPGNPLTGTANRNQYGGNDKIVPGNNITANESATGDHGTLIAGTDPVRDPYPYLPAYLHSGKVLAGVQAPAAKKGSAAAVSNSIAQKLSKPRYRKWEYALDLKGGYSSLQSGLFEAFTSSTPEYVANYMASPGINNQALMANLTFVERKPSSIKAGPAFQAQLQVSRLLSKKWRLGVGVQYAYMSNLVRFGAVVDSSATMAGNQFMVAMAARPGAGEKNSDFTNTYHAVMFPVEFSWNFDNHERWYLNSGFSAGMLAGLNAYQFNSRSGYYYKDDKSFNRFQAALFTGLYYTINPKSALPVSAGPTVQYHLSNVGHTGDDRKMLFLGLGARLKFRPTLKGR